MFRNTYQKGFLSVFSSTGSKPLATWNVQVQNGHIKRVTDCDLSSLVLEIVGRNVATTYICTPCTGYCSLAIKLPFLILIVKNLKKFFTFEIQILDDANQLRRFRVSNYQSTTRVKPFCTSMPLCLSPGWNQIQFNLADFVRRAYGTNYVETIRIQVHANVRLRRIFFADKLYAEEDKPEEYRLFKSIREKPPKTKSVATKKVTEEKETLRPVTPVSIDHQNEDVDQTRPPTTQTENPTDTSFSRKTSKVSMAPQVTIHDIVSGDEDGGPTSDDQAHSIQTDTGVEDENADTNIETTDQNESQADNTETEAQETHGVV